MARGWESKSVESQVESAQSDGHGSSQPAGDGNTAAEKAAAHARAAETFGGLLPRFLDYKRKELKPRGYQEVERYLVAHAKPLHGLAVEGIARRTISDRLAEIEAWRWLPWIGATRPAFFLRADYATVEGQLVAPHRPSGQKY